MMPKLDPHTPRHNLHAFSLLSFRLIYGFYRVLFNVTMGIAAFGYALFLINIFGFASVGLMDASLTLMFYGLYFGVLSRDLIDFGADRMASTIGVFMDKVVLCDVVLQQRGISCQGTAV